MPDTFSEADRKKFACRCGTPSPRYHPAHDDIMCLLCKRWISGAFPQAPDDRPLMPYGNYSRVTHEQSRRRRVRAVAAVRDGADLDGAAELFGMGVATLAKACESAGVSAWKTGHDRGPVGTIVILAEILKDPERSLAGIADRFGVSRQRVHQIHRDAVICGVPGLAARRAPRPTKEVAADAQG